MQVRRAEMLAKLASAVDGVGKLYARLLELSATSQVTGGAAVPAPDPVAEANSSPDAIRQAFGELETDAAGVSDRLSVPDDRRQPPAF